MGNRDQSKGKKAKKRGYFYLVHGVEDAEKPSFCKGAAIRKREGRYVRRKYLEENAAAVEIKLTPDDVAELEVAVPGSEIVGERYAAANLKAINR